MAPSAARCSSRITLRVRSDRRWKGLDVPEGELFAWDENSTYVRKQTFFDGMKATPDPVKDIHGARVLALLGDSVTTDTSPRQARSRPPARQANT